MNFGISTDFSGTGWGSKAEKKIGIKKELVKQEKDHRLMVYRGKSPL